MIELEYRDGRRTLTAVTLIPDVSRGLTPGRVSFMRQGSFWQASFPPPPVDRLECQAYPIDYANASPDLALTSLHYYFPWAIEALARWALFCAVSGRRMRVALDLEPYFEAGDREELGYEEKLREYRRLADEYFQREAYEEFSAEALPNLHELVLEYVESPAFDTLLVDTVRETFPLHEQEQFSSHYRGLLAAWAADQR